MRLLKYSLFSLFVIALSSASAQVKHITRTSNKIPAATMQQGLLVYKKVCLACHMADGLGVSHMNPPIVKTTYILGDKATLIKIVLNGFKEDVEINGQTYSNNMTPHADLKDEEIAGVLTYVRNSFGNKASAVSVAQVKLVRAGNRKL